MRHFGKLLLLALWVILPLTCHAQEINVIANNLPPFKLIRDGRTEGIMVDVLSSVFEKMGRPWNPESIQTTSWARAYDTALHTPDTIILGMAMTEERKPLFKWVGPVYSITLGLIGKKEKRFDIRTAQDAARYRVGTLRDTAPETMLFAQGFPKEKAERISKTVFALKMLDEGRIDLFSHTSDSSFYMMPELGINPEEYTVYYVIKKVDLYFGLNKAFDDAFVNLMQCTFERMKLPDADGVSEYDRIVSKYIK